LQAVADGTRYGHLLPRSEDRVNDALDVLASSAIAAPEAVVINLH
jgi:hypothetical protein